MISNTACGPLVTYFLQNIGTVSDMTGREYRGNVDIAVDTFNVAAYTNLLPFNGGKTIQWETSLFKKK